MHRTGRKEHEIQNDILYFLNAKGIYCWRQNSGCAKIGNRYIKFTSINGIADIIGIAKDGRFLAIECKREKGGVLSDSQKAFLESIEKNGGITIIANSLDTVIERLVQEKII